MILAIDIGGTKTLLALYRKKGNNWSLYKEASYKSIAFNGIEEIINKFLGADKQGIEAVSAGVAGTVIDQECQITNLSWKVSIKAVQEVTGVKRVYLINDLAATAWAVALANMQYEEINTSVDKLSSVSGRGRIAILSAGTGLGEAILIQDIKGMQSANVLATEGGHGSFAPQNEQQDRLLAFLRKKYKGHVSYERLVSGAGLHNIYLFLQSEGVYLADKKITEKMQSSDPAEIIGLEAISGNNRLCEEAVKLFCDIYAAEAGNLALKCLPEGGVVLAGGMPPKILSIVKQQFMRSFRNKGRYSTYLASLSVRVCMNEKAVLLGALAYAKLQAK